MLDKQDLEMIREIMRDELVPVRKEITEQISELRKDVMSVLEENIMPQFEYMHQEFAAIRRELADMKHNARIVWTA